MIKFQKKHRNIVIILNYVVFLQQKKMFNINKFQEIHQLLEKNEVLCKIIAVSKNHSQEKVLEAINQGVCIFGENRVIEARDKFYEIKEQNPNIELHLTGPLQSNKVKLASKLFDVFHTLDREKIAQELAKYKHNLLNKKILIQVNTGKETNKSGIYPSDLKEFMNFCQKDMGLNITGLMCIPPIDDDPKIHFEQLRSLAKLNNVKELSIGMSNDYEDAINFNPSYIRLGTILFGKRN